MTRSPGTHGVVTMAALDLRKRPEHRAELGSQLLLGETVRVIGQASRGQWLRVRNEADGYAGWVRAWGIRRVSRVRAGRWRDRARARVNESFAAIRAREAAGPLLMPAFWNSRLIAGPRRGRTRRVELPDGRRGWIAARAIAPPRRPMPVVHRIRELLGTPYLWGGRTPHGLDCSGFVQQVLAEQGIALPRDAHEQFRVARARLEPVELRLGDLIFFGVPRNRVGHVGLVLGGGYFAHCRGWVRVNSMNTRNPLCDNELMAQWRGFGRP